MSFRRFMNCAQGLDTDSSKLEISGFFFCQKSSTDSRGRFDPESYDRCIDDCVANEVCKPFDERYRFLVGQEMKMEMSSLAYSFQSSRQSHAMIVDAQDCMLYNLTASQRRVGSVVLLFVIVIFVWFVGLLNF